MIAALVMFFTISPAIWEGNYALALACFVAFGLVGAATVTWRRRRNAEPRP
jgi:hypothetical protein